MFLEKIGQNNTSKKKGGKTAYNSFYREASLPLDGSCFTG